MIDAEDGKDLPRAMWGGKPLAPNERQRSGFSSM
jgi:hypothetical protein